MMFSNFHVYFWKKLCLYIISLKFIQFFWDFLDITYILYKLPNSSEINLIRFSSKILNFWRFNMNS
jgi:hypothetical protein